MLAPPTPPALPARRTTVRGWLRAAPKAARANAGRLVLLAVWAALVLVAFFQLDALAGAWPGWTLRYHAPINGQQAANARRHAVDNADRGLWPTFWSEGSAKLDGGLFSADSSGLWYSGEGRLVWPVRFAQGEWPGATDENGCVLSSALAQRLWGSADVLGRAVKIGDNTFYVRGVFDSDESLWLARVGDTGAPDGWQAVEFDTGGAQKSEVLAFVQAAGLGAPDSLLEGAAIAGLGSFLCWLPVALAAAVLLVRWVRAVLAGRPLATKVLAAVLLFTFALLLPRMLGWLPQWVIPSQWSDFAHWAALLDELGSTLRGFLLLRPAARDLGGKLALLLAGGASLLACPLGLWLLSRGKQKTPGGFPGEALGNE